MADKDIDELKKAMNTARHELLTELQSDSLTNFGAHRINSAIRAIDDIMDTLAETMTGIVEAAVFEHFNEGQLLAAADLIPSLKPLLTTSPKNVMAVFEMGVSRESVMGLVRVRTDLVRGITQEMAKRMKTDLQLGVLKNESTGEIARRLVRAGDNEPKAAMQVTENRATVIVRTERQRATETGSFTATRRAEEQFRGRFEVWRIWHPVMDKFTRPGHIAARIHKPVRMNEPFKIWASKPGRLFTLLHPGDGGGSPTIYSAENLIACRCTLVKRAFKSGAKREDVAKVLRP